MYSQMLKDGMTEEQVFELMERDNAVAQAAPWPWDVSNGGYDSRRRIRNTEYKRTTPEGATLVIVQRSSGIRGYYAYGAKFERWAEGQRAAGLIER
jgi:hypothetical protein